MTPEELLNNKNIEYNYSGRDLVVTCLNPEHEDVHPSMRIDKISGKFRCTSCNYSGNIFTYFNEQVNLLDVTVLEVKEKINQLLQPKTQIPLGSIPFTKGYRNISKETFSKFKAFTNEDEKFRDRLLFPIYNIEEELEVLHGRCLNSEVKPKYKNFPGGKELPIYPPFFEIYNGTIILVEGIFDLLTLYENNITNVVTAFGLPVPKKRNKDKLLSKFEILKIQGINKLVILLDGDEAGVNASKQIKSALSTMFITEIVFLPPDTDVNSLDREQFIELKEYLHENSYCR